jgi:hypothetical protein
VLLEIPALVVQQVAIEGLRPDPANHRELCHGRRSTPSNVHEEP